MSGWLMADGAESVGLCFTCRWMRTVTSRRGSTFYRCMRADSDPRFVRYPPLPVRVCPGYERLDTQTQPTHRGEP